MDVIEERPALNFWRPIRNFCLRLRTLSVLPWKSFAFGPATQFDSTHKNMEVDTIEKPRSVVYQNGATTVKKTRQDLLPRHETEKKRRQREAERAYGRGKKINVRNIKDKKLRSNMKRLEHKYQDATMKAKDAEILLENTAGFLEPEAELERTYKVRQDEILSGVAVETATKRFDLKLEDMGPYVFDYSRNGRDLLLGGKKGHIATMDWREGKLGCERQLGEIVRDVKWLHNNQYFAAAQKKYVYIYDHNGVELHCLKKHTEVTQMEFLPYHFLLATIVSTHTQSATLTSANKIRELVVYSDIKIPRPVSSSPNYQPASALPSQ